MPEGEASRVNTRPFDAGDVADQKSRNRGIIDTGILVDGNAPRRNSQLFFELAILADVAFDVGVTGRRQFVPSDDIGENAVRLTIAEEGRNEGVVVGTCAWTDDRGGRIHLSDQL